MSNPAFDQHGGGQGALAFASQPTTSNNVVRQQSLIDSIPLRPAARQAQAQANRPVAGGPELLTDNFGQRSRQPGGNQGIIQNSTQQANIRSGQPRAAIEQSQQNFDGLISDYNSLLDNEGGRVNKNASQPSFPRTRGVRNRANPGQFEGQQSAGKSPFRSSPLNDETNDLDQSDRNQLIENYSENEEIGFEHNDKYDMAL